MPSDQFTRFAMTHSDSTIAEFLFNLEDVIVRPQLFEMLERYELQTNEILKGIQMYKNGMYTDQDEG